MARPAGTSEARNAAIPAMARIWGMPLDTARKCTVGTVVRAAEIPSNYQSGYGKWRIVRTISDTSSWSRKVACGGLRTLVFGVHFVFFLFWPPDAEHPHARRCVCGRFHARHVGIAYARSRAYERFQPVQDRGFCTGSWDRRIGIGNDERKYRRAESGKPPETSGG